MERRRGVEEDEGGRKEGRAKRLGAARGAGVVWECLHPGVRACVLGGGRSGAGGVGVRSGFIVFRFG